jgi:hypothetical protein
MQMSSNKAPGPDGIPADIFKVGGQELLTRLLEVFQVIWEKEEVPQDFRDANIIHLYKRKGDKSTCDNHRGISLLAAAGKILARIMLNRLNDSVLASILPESQCGFRAQRSTADMIFTARQIQEKCIEQNQDLYFVFVDLTKAFDSVNREALWRVMERVGCPPKFIKITRSFHDGMYARVMDHGQLSDPFSISNGVKQGCVLAPTLFSILFSALLSDAFVNSNDGVYVRYRYDGGLFNLRRLQAKSKVNATMLRDLLFADDCALGAHNLPDIQTLVDCFAHAASNFGLKINLKKTEVMYQPRPGAQYVKPTVLVDGVVLNVVDKFCYLGSILSQTARIDDDVTRRIAAASASFGKLEKRLWSDHGVKRATKIAVYRAVVLSSLLYGCETWTTYRHHVQQLEQFHMRCLRRILGVKWQDKVTNVEVLERCGSTSIEALVIAAQLRWTGHVLRMREERIPKQILYGELSGTRHAGGQRKRYKDNIKTNLKECNISLQTWEQAAHDRSVWRTVCYNGVRHFETQRTQHITKKRVARKERQAAAAAGASSRQQQGQFVCDVCQRDCGAPIGLYSHRRTHLPVT